MDNAIASKWYQKLDYKSMNLVFAALTVKFKQWISN